MPNESNEEDEIQSIATTILNNDENKALSSIHSTKSIKMLVKQSCNSMSAPLNAIVEEENCKPVGDIHITPPITKHHFKLIFETDAQRRMDTVFYGDLHSFEIYNGEDTTSQFGNAIQEGIFGKVPNAF